MLKEQLIFLIKNLGRYEQINGILDKSTQYYRIGDDYRTSLESLLTLVKGHNSVDVLVYLWELHLLEKHLLTIFLLNNNIKDNDTKSIIVIITELFVLMTTPVDLDQIVDFADDNVCLQRDILKAQHAYKELFAKNPIALRTLLNLLNDHLKIEISMHTENNVMIVRLVLSLFRNLLAIDKKDKRLHIFYHIFYGIEPSDILENPTAEDRRRFNERFSGKYWVKMPDGYEILTSKKDARANKLLDRSEDKENKRPIKDEWLPKKNLGLDINDTTRDCLKVTAIKFLNTIFT
ncbi:43824_t:CDS:2, partial [Gigaspora margarita]